MARLCGKKCEVYSRIVGYYRPVDQWNAGKKEEYKERKVFSETVAMDKPFVSDVSPQQMEMPMVNSEISSAIASPSIQKYQVFSLPNCSKCASVKEYLMAADISGCDTNLGDDEGVKVFRNYYKQIKDKVHRNEDGSLPVPTVLFFDGQENIVGTAHNVDQVKSVLGY